MQVGLPALENGGKFSSNGSLLSQNGIKYSSEPELGEGGGAVGGAGEQPESAGYVALERRGPGLGQFSLLPGNENRHRIGGQSGQGLLARCEVTPYWGSATALSSV